MKLLGKIKKIFNTKNFGSFKKKELLLKTNEQYSQLIIIDFVQIKRKLLKKFKINDKVTIYINIRGRLWINPKGEKKYFNTIQGWKIEKNNEEKNDNENTEGTDVFGNKDFLKNNKY
ncbi:MAG: DUF3127 domain-containing protein [Candidatus Shikimatogenerans sp. AspAUS03]|uniref:DUF3127 domain-containing protein n=1 Tax=Candidatus Shikimatogenerans sp. AspAUS03 TaxID=3158563 RepID=A0AAU7QSX4_9FLAO